MSLKTLPLLVAGLAECIRFPPFVQNVFGIGQPRPSVIPQFILDTEHAWLKDNKRWLSQYPDVRRAICDKTSPLWQHAHDNDKRLPENLFHNLQIYNTRYEVSRLGWKNAMHKLTEMKSCQAALQEVRHLHIDIWVHDSKLSDYTEKSMPSPELAALLADVLPAMINLERLDFGVTGRSSVAFEKAFAHANVTLPSVTHLQPGAYSDWILPRCPNVEVVVAGSFSHHWSWNTYDAEMRLRIDKHEALLDAMQGLPIRRLSLFDLDWSLEKLQKIVDAGLNLTMLEIRGPLQVRKQWTLPKGEALKRYLSHIAQFSHLEELRLSEPSDLGLGFDRGPDCGNAYFGKWGRANGRERTRQSAKTTEAAARIVHEALPRLEYFTIGSACPNITKNDVGTMDMIWPWTGRLTEYTYDVWPESNEEDDEDDAE